MNAIEQFHQSGRRCVVAITGGGTRLIGDLLGVPGGSATILEAIVPYSQKSLANFLKRAPDKYCAPETALAMAAAAFERARHLSETIDDKSFGLGVTASLISTRPKRGEHRAFIAYQNDVETVLASVTLAKDVRPRAEEEALVTSVGLNLLRRGAGLTDAEPLTLPHPQDRLETNCVRAAASWREVRNSHEPVVVGGGSKEGTRMPEPASALLSGSFNPLHHGHLRLRDAAAEFLGRAVDFEFPIVNADKPPLDDITLQSRLTQFQHPVVLTAAPTFVDKARKLPRTTFVVGVDTAARILDPKFYPASSLDDAMATVRHQKCQFLVAARHDHGEVISLADLDIPDRYRDLFVELPVERFLEDVSSTAIRSSNL